MDVQRSISRKRIPGVWWVPLPTAFMHPWDRSASQMGGGGVGCFLETPPSIPGGGGGGSEPSGYHRTRFFLEESLLALLALF